MASLRGLGVKYQICMEHLHIGNQCKQLILCQHSHRPHLSIDPTWVAAISIYSSLIHTVVTYEIFSDNHIFRIIIFSHTTIFKKANKQKHADTITVDKCRTTSSKLFYIGPCDNDRILGQLM